jgi:hypothetical protein
MARAPTPPPAKNTVRVGPANPEVTRVFTPGKSFSRPDVATDESRSLAAEEQAKRAEYAAQERKAQAEMSAERARQASATD